MTFMPDSVLSVTANAQWLFRPENASGPYKGLISTASVHERTTAGLRGPIRGARPLHLAQSFQRGLSPLAGPFRVGGRLLRDRRLRLLGGHASSIGRGTEIAVSRT